jgi:glutaryl-CoA dehydrogenase
MDLRFPGAAGLPVRPWVMMADVTAAPRPTFDPGDPLGFDDLLDELVDDEARAVRDSTAKLLEAEVAPHVAGWFEAGTLPARELARTFGALGLLGMHLEGYGCAGPSAVAYGLACRELEAVDSGIRSLVSVQGSLAMTALHRFGTDEQRTAWLPRLAAGEALGCFGLTEPDAGSDPASMRTRAGRVGSDWVLDGRKAWITNGSVADVAVVWAGTDEGIRGFLVPTDAPGFTAIDVPARWSLRASVTSDLVLDGVRLPADALLPEGRGLRAPLSCLDEARYGIVWGTAGSARTSLRTALAYALDREQFGRPIAGFQLTQQKLAELALAVGKAELLALHLGRRKDAGTLHPAQVSMGKLDNARTALEAARTARSVLGANGTSLAYPVVRHLANLETVVTYEGTAEMHTLVVGHALTGLPAFR